MPKGYMKQSEIAALLGVSRPTVFRFLRDKNIENDMIDGQTKLYSQEKVLMIVDAFRSRGAEAVQEDSEQLSGVVDGPLNTSSDQVPNWETIAEIYREQLESANAALLKALDSLDREQETKQQLLLQLENKEKRGFWARLFDR